MDRNSHGPILLRFDVSVSERDVDSEHFRAKWILVRVKKMRKNKKLEPGSDSIRTGKTLERRGDSRVKAAPVRGPDATEFGRVRLAPILANRRAFSTPEK